MKGGLETGVIKTARIEYEVVDREEDFNRAIDFQALLDILDRFLPGFKSEYNKRRLELLDEAAEQLFPTRRRRRKPEHEDGPPVEDLLEV